MRTLIARSLTGALLLALAACAQPPLPQDHFYRLDAPQPKAAAAQPRLKGVIEIPRFTADGLVAGRPLVYAETGKEHELLDYHYHFWVEPPGVMAQDRLIHFLRAAKLADNVVAPEMRLEPDYVINGRIRRLERVIGSRTPKAVLEMEIGLRGAKTNRILWLETYKVDSDCAEDSVTAAVQAFNQALGTVYQRFLDDALRALPPS